MAAKRTIVVKMPATATEHWGCSYLDVFTPNEQGVLELVGTVKDVWELQALITLKSGDYDTGVVFEGDAWGRVNSWLTGVKAVTKQCLKNALDMFPK